MGAAEEHFLGYDWSGQRTRRLMVWKWVSVASIGIFPAAVAYSLLISAT